MKTKHHIRWNRSVLSADTPDSLTPNRERLVPASLSTPPASKHQPKLCLYTLQQTETTKQQQRWIKSHTWLVRKSVSKKQGDIQEDLICMIWNISKICVFWWKIWQILQRYLHGYEPKRWENECEILIRVSKCSVWGLVFYVGWRISHFHFFFTVWNNQNTAFRK